MTNQQFATLVIRMATYLKSGDEPSARALAAQCAADDPEQALVIAAGLVMVVAKICHMSDEDMMVLAELANESGDEKNADG